MAYKDKTAQAVKKITKEASRKNDLNVPTQIVTVGKGSYDILEMEQIEKDDAMKEALMGQLSSEDDQTVNKSASLRKRVQKQQVKLSTQKDKLSSVDEKSNEGTGSK